MAWYRTGTVSVTNNNAVVTGIGTTFVSAVKPGDAIQVAGGNLAEVLSIQSDTQLTLAQPYGGSTQAGQPYVVVPVRGYVRDLAVSAAQLVQSFSDLQDEINATAFDWTRLTGVPTTFAPSAHAHVIADVTGLQTALDGKAAQATTYTKSEVDTGFAGKTHSHVIGDVTGLQTALDGKQAAGSYAAASHTHALTSLTGTLGVPNGGTGATSLTSGYLVKGNGTAAASASVVYDDGTNVGIGTVPSYKLDVSATGNISGQFKTSGSINALFLADAGTTAGTLYIGTVGNDFRVVAGSNEAMRVTSAGNLGIGTTSPSVKLDVAAGHIRMDDGYKLRWGDGTAAWEGSGASDVLIAYTSNTERMRLDASGNLGIGTSSPNARLHVLAAGGASDVTIRARTSNLINPNPGAEIVGAQIAIGANILLSERQPSGAFVDRTDLAFVTNTGFGLGSSEKMRLDAAGNLGIGTSSPGYKLDVNGAATTMARFTGPEYSQVRFVGGTQACYIQNWNSVSRLSTSGATPLTFGTDDTERMRITSAGDLGLGISSVSPVFGRTMRIYNSANGGTLQIGGDTVNCYLYASDALGKTALGNSTNHPLAFFTNDTERMRLDASGNLGIGTSSPSSFTGYTSLTVSHPTNGGLIEATNGTSTLRMQTQAAGNPLFGTTTSHNLEVMTAGVTRVTLDTSGNLGLGVTPSAWDSILRPFETYNGVFLAAQTNATANLFLGANAYYGGGSWKYKVTGQKATHYNQLDGTHAWYTAPSGTAGAAISFTQAMTLDASGNLGVGTTTPQDKIDALGNIRSSLASGSSATFRGFAMSSDTTEFASLKAQASTGETRLTAGFGGFGGYTTFYTNGSERARIDSSGNLLVGKTASNFDTTGMEYLASSKILRSTTASNAALQLQRTTTTGDVAQFWYNTVLVGSISVTGSATTYNTSSDARLKENIADADSASNLIDQIKVRKYDWKSDGSHQRYGFIAQELLPVAPEAVSQPEDPDQMMGVDYSKLVPMLVKEIQDLRARVASLESTTS